MFRNTARPFKGASVPKDSRNSVRTTSTESPMQGRMSPGLLTLNSLPGDPHAEQESPSRSVPQESHQRSASFPCAALILSAILRSENRHDL